MKFDHPDHKGYSFELPDKWSVRLALDYDSEIELGLSLSQSYYVRLWNALLAVIDEGEWHCKDVPLDVDLDKKQNKKTLEIIKWAGLAGYSARSSINANEKN